MNISNCNFRPEERIWTIASAEAIIDIFSDITAWLHHLLKHIGERSEPWAKCLQIKEMGQVYSVHDRISNLGAEAYIEKFYDLCQDGDPEAVNICQRGTKLYAIIAPKLADDVQRGLNIPRYVYMQAERIKWGHGKKSLEQQAYIITEPCAAVAVIRHTTLRTIYFPKKSILGRNKRVDVAQRHLWNKIGRSWSQGCTAGWRDEGNHTLYQIHSQDVRPFTPKTLGWTHKL